MQGRAALVVVGIDTCQTGGQRVCYNEVTYFIRGSGVIIPHACTCA